MTRFSKSLIVGGMTALIGLGAAGASIAHDTGKDASMGDGWACEIAVGKANGMLVLESSVLAERALSGDYVLRVKSAGGGGNTNISQGGGFDAKAHEPYLLGKLMLNGSATYDVELAVNVGGDTANCAKTISKSI